jgi:hypothetical protein
MKKSLIFIILLFCQALPAQRASFFKEDITFRLNGRSLDVDGYYWFANNSGQTVKSEIFYPFPNYKGEKIDSIRLFNITRAMRAINQRNETHGISFELSLAPGDTALYQIGYRQELFSDSAEYILKSTQDWGRPLSHAEYKLIIPDTIVITNFSYKPDRLYEIERCHVYYWQKENFLPSEDMIFCFKKQK